MSAVCDVEKEIAWLDEMAHDTRWRWRGDDEMITDRVQRAEAFALQCSSWAMFAERERADLKSDLSHSDRFNGWLRLFALGDVLSKLAVLAPCYAVVAAGHEKRMKRDAGGAR